MTMFDSSPERRNLNLLSISIILYYLAGGYILGNGTAKIEVLNIGFKDKNVLVYSVVIFLLWFLFRYWIVEREESSQKYKAEVCNINIAKLYRFFVDNSIKDSFIIFQACTGAEMTTVNGITTVLGKRLIKIDGFGGNIIRLFIIVKMFFTKPTLSAYIMPYMLSFIALYLTSIYLFIPIVLLIILVMYFQE
ncbi:MAG: hypothetical protein Q9M36_11515 [Sulfurovum sp.]|nr:hypothetical protein [Sulfurovum sp.]